MTALCGGGTSAPIVGIPTTQLVDAATFGNLLNELGAGPLSFFAGLIGQRLYNLATLCNTDPPALHTFTEAEMIALFNPLDVVNYLAALGLLENNLLHFLWYKWCRCTSGALVPQPPFPPLPSTVAPPQGSNTGTCFTGRRTGTAVQQTTPVSSEANDGLLTPAWTPVTLTGVVGSPGITYYSLQLPTPIPTSFTVTTAVQFQAGATQPFNWGVYFFSDATHFAQAPSSAGLAPAGGLSQTRIDSVPIPATTKYIVLLAVETNQPAPSQAQVQVDWYCGGNAAGVMTTPCAPDPTTLGLLQAILGQVNLIQRQAVPFASILGTVHAGLAGAGSFAVQGLLGMKIEVTAVPPSSASVQGSPPYYYNLGWVSLSTGDGFIDERRITSLAQVWMPPMMSDATLFGYSLQPGVTATLTEIRRES